MYAALDRGRGRCRPWSSAIGPSGPSRARARAPR